MRLLQVGTEYLIKISDECKNISLLISAISCLEISIVNLKLLYFLCFVQFHYSNEACHDKDNNLTG